MKIPFDKIYVLSMPSCKDRYEFVKYQLNDLKIDYEILWATDFGNFKNDSMNNLIKYPNIWEYENFTSGKDFSCTINHYNAVYQAYEFGYNKILIIEDDICFIKNKQLLETMFNNIPEDADFVTYDPRFWEASDFNKFENDINDKNIIKNLYFKDTDRYDFMFGGLLYAIMNRETMKLYLDNQRKNLVMSDHVRGLFMYVSVNKYISTKCICTDQYNIKTNFNVQHIPYKNNYKDLNIFNFYIPKKYHEFERDIPQINK